MTHVKKLHIDDPFKTTLSDFQRKAYILKEKLGTILWQFPHSVKLNLERLEHFFQLLDPGIQHVVEFRDLSWFNEEVYQLLAKYHVTFCMLSAPGFPEEARFTSPIGYLRFHGKDWYRYNYTHDDLYQWKQILASSRFEKLFVYFNNDFEAHAVYNGLTFAEMLKESDITYLNKSLQMK